MMHVQQLVGSRAPLHVTAVGKLMLGAAGDEAIRGLCAAHQPPRLHPQHHHHARAAEGRMQRGRAARLRAGQRGGRDRCRLHRVLLYDGTGNVAAGLSVSARSSAGAWPGRRRDGGRPTDIGATRPSTPGMTTLKCHRRATCLSVGVLLSLMVLFWVPDGAMPTSANRVAAIAVLMAVLWITEAIPIPATALLPVALFPILGVMPVEDATANYANHLVFLFPRRFLDRRRGRAQPAAPADRPSGARPGGIARTGSSSASWPPPPSCRCG